MSILVNGRRVTESKYGNCHYSRKVETITPTTTTTNERTIHVVGEFWKRLAVHWLYSLVLLILLLYCCYLYVHMYIWHLVWRVCLCFCAVVRVSCEHVLVKFPSTKHRFQFHLSFSHRSFIHRQWRRRHHHHNRRLCRLCRRRRRHHHRRYRWSCANALDVYFYSSIGFFFYSYSFVLLANSPIVAYTHL